MWDSSLEALDKYSADNAPTGFWYGHVITQKQNAKAIEIVRNGDVFKLNGGNRQVAFIVNGVGDTQAIVLLRTAAPPRSITLDGQNLEDFNYSPKDKLLWIRFENIAQHQTLSVNF